MSKKIDKAGHWLIKANPLSREGVYMYSGRVIDPAGEFGLEPDALYPVYRPREELAKGAESFNGVEIRNEHEMIGDGAGMTPADSTVCGGTVFNVRMNPDDGGEMICDMRIFGNELRALIKTGKKQLSLGYHCKYRKEGGEFGGKPYDFVQYDLEGNHVALVKEGRMGSGVRVFDSITFDSVEIPKMNIKEEIAKMLEGKDEDVLAKCKDALENVLNPDKGTDGDDDPKDKPEGEDEDEPKNEPEKGKDCGDEDEPEDKPEGEDEDEDKEKSEDDPCPHCGTELGLKEEGKGKDAKGMDMKEVMREIARRDRIADGVADVIGAFDHSEMTVQEVATYACDKLELSKEGDCVARVEGFIAAHKAAKKVSVSATATDAAEESSDFVSKYLNNK